MTDQTPEPENLSSEFRELGENLAEMLRAAWDRPERKNIQKEIENGLNEFGAVLNETARDFSGSDVGQKIKEGTREIKARVNSGELENTIRSEVQDALRMMNTELQKLIGKIREAGEEE